MKRKLIAILLMASVISALVIASPAMAATAQNVTVTAAPAYIAITMVGNGGGSPAVAWTLNGFATVPGDSLIDPSTSYYANPLGDTTAPANPVVLGGCGWTVTDTSSVTIKLYVYMTDFTGGGANMTNGTGTAGVSAYAAWCYKVADAFPAAKLIIPATQGATALFTGSTPGDGDISWGAMLTTQSGDWSSGSSSTATLTIKAIRKP